MRVLKQLGADLGRILAAIFGTAFVLVFTSGVGEGVADAADTGEVVIGLGFGAVVVGLAAMAISYVVLPSLSHLATAYGAALDGRPSASARGYYLMLGVLEGASALLVVALGAWRYRHGVAAGELAWAQQGALVLVGGLVLGGGAALARLIAAVRAEGGKKGAAREWQASVAKELARAEARSARSSDQQRALAFCLGLGLALAMAINGAP